MTYDEFMAEPNACFGRYVISGESETYYSAYTNNHGGTQLTVPITIRLTVYGIMTMGGRKQFYDWYFLATQDMVDRLNIQMKLDGENNG